MVWGRCELCGDVDVHVSSALGVCRGCVRDRWDQASERVERAHEVAREPFDLPANVPKDRDGALCPVCANGCLIPDGGRGYCGLRANEGGRLVHAAGIPSRGLCGPYHDPQPTNCVAGWTCPGTREVGKRNLAVFYLGCSMDCLFCQNWSCRMTVRGDRGETLSADAVAAMVDEDTNCVCFFGGDPAPHAPHALKVARLAVERRPGTRICWETNGRWSPHLRERMIGSSLTSGGIVKVDLKAWDQGVHRALTGATRDATLETIDVVTARARERPSVPLLVVSTLLVPGYVDGVEVGRIAEHLASLDPVPPYSLLAFHGDFEMRDLPSTSMADARAALDAALDAGLEEVHLGNVHLLA